MLKILWQELDLFYEADWGELEDHVKFKTHLDKERLYEFLVGLNRDLDEVRGRILGRKPLPSIGEAFAEVRREENRRRVMLGDQNSVNYQVAAAGDRPTETTALAVNKTGGFSGNRNLNKQGERPWCTHCNKQGHTRENCFHIHGFPPN
ncbi:hypothetical protein PanWU01x14_103900 [Parasponia andersonii]|uniref:Zinc finger, CCHC-type n=1 Tax=Parasponia andersonii TaxID=3476 RepID=A0A2P5D1V1_PARAD|nr:hypothetical protein PanWU01x14_103900 [Parasponia andersonii]